MRQLRKLWTISNILLLVGCASIEHPDTNLCVINTPLSQMKCYNLKRDYEPSGSIKPNAVPQVIPLKGMEDLNKFICTDPDGFANLKAYIKALREEAK